MKASVPELAYRRYAQDVGLRISPVLGGAKLAKLTSAHVQALYAAKLSDGLAGSTVRVLHKALRKALGQEGWCPRPCQRPSYKEFSRPLGRGRENLLRHRERQPLRGLFPQMARHRPRGGADLRQAQRGERR